MKNFTTDRIGRWNAGIFNWNDRVPLVFFLLLEDGKNMIYWTGNASITSFDGKAIRGGVTLHLGLALKQGITNSRMYRMTLLRRVK